MKARSPAIAAALLSLVGCATVPSSLTLPQNWDDSLLDRAADAQAVKPVLAVLPFDVSKGAKGASQLKLADMVTTALFKTGRFELVERERLQAILDEQHLATSGLVDDASKAAQVGKLAGAQAVVSGALSGATQQTIDKFAYDVIRTEVRIDARAVNTSTGKVTFSESATGTAEAKVVRAADGTLISGLKNADDEFVKAATNATDALGARLSRLYPLMGYVVSVSGDEVITDLGADKGINVGDELVAFRKGQRIVHPVTGQNMGWQKEMLDLLKVQGVDLRSSKVRRGNQTNKPLRPGDVVVLRPAG
jgi:curli biogenesis system outer membrane secretion channel CsgG